jgi:hypothetical protein
MLLLLSVERWMLLLLRAERKMLLLLSVERMMMLPLTVEREMLLLVSVFGKILLLLRGEKIDNNAAPRLFCGKTLLTFPKLSAPRAVAPHFWYDIEVKEV